MKARSSTIAGAAVCILATSMGFTGSALAESESPHQFSANVALTTNYMFRGVSQTNNGPAIQGGFDYKYSPYSLYAGVWASNVDSDGFSGASMELDIYAGWAPSWQGIDFDLGYLRYQYPVTDYSDNNTNEFHLGVSYDVQGYFTPSFTAYYSNDFFGLDDAWYYDLGVEVPLPYDFTLAGHYGWNRFDNSYDSLDYEDYSVGISRDFMGFGFDLSWVSRSDESDCGAPFQCGDTAVFTVSKTF